MDRDNESRRLEHTPEGEDVVVYDCRACRRPHKAYLFTPAGRCKIQGWRSTPSVTPGACFHRSRRTR